MSTKNNKTFIMRKLQTFWAIVCLFFFQVSNAQTYDTTTYYGKMNYMFDHLDKTPVTTGLLREYGIDFQMLEDYNGQSLTDSNWVTLTDWRGLYGTLYSEQINGNANLLYLDTVNHLIGKYAQSTLPVSFVCLYYNYQVIDTNAVINNLISISNGQLYDVPNRPMAPYITHSTFAIATTQQKVFTGSPQLIFRPELFLSNTGKSVSSLQVDAGTGYQAASFNTPITLNYTSSGLYPITVKVTYTDGTVNYSHTKLSVSLPTGGSAVFNGWAEPFKGTGPPLVNKSTPPYGYGYYYPQSVTATKTYQGVAGQGDITIDYSITNSTGQIRKPLIVVNGFDPEANSPNYPYSGYTYDPSYLQNINYDLNYADYYNHPLTLNTGLDDNRGYDLIFVHWKNGTDYIQRNAYFLEAVINYVNASKTTYNGVRQQNVIIGMSMGGLVARYALRDMELNGQNHDTRLFVSQDAPHWGANVPVGVQALVQQIAPWKIIDAGFNGSPFQFYLQYKDLFPDAVAAENLFNSPAAKQMLIQRYILTPQTGALTADNGTHASFMNELNSMGWPGCRNVTLSNGRCTGGTSFPDYTQMINITGKQNWSYLGGLWRSLALSFGGVVLWNPVWTGGSIPINNFSLLFQFPLSIISTKQNLNFDFGVWSVPSSGSNLILKGDIFIKRKLLWVFDQTSYLIKCHAYSSSEMLPLDNAPGGVYDISKFGVDVNNINYQLQSQIGNWVHLTVPQPSFCFVPTVSSLALTNAQQYLTSPICGNINCLNPPQVSDYYAPQQNQVHISYTQDNTNWLLQTQDAATGCVKICPSSLSISGVGSVCSSATYSVAGLPPGATVSWSVSPSGYAGLSVSGNQATLTQQNKGNVVLTATVGNACQGSVPVQRPIVIGAMAQQPVIGGASDGMSFCGGGSFNVYITSGSMNNIFWDAPGGQVLSGQGTTEAIIGLPNSPGAGWAVVLYTDDECGNTLPAAEVYGNIIDCGGGGGGVSSRIKNKTDSSQGAALAVDQATDQVLSVYPNPAHNAVYVRLPSGTDLSATSIVLTDASGRMVRRVTSPVSVNTISISDLAPGLYLVKILQGHTVTVKKVIKN